MATGIPGAPGVVRGSLTAGVPDLGEDFHDLVRMAGVRIEHIVSSADPDAAEQVQRWDEWVLVLAGAGELEVAGRAVALGAGDWMLLPAGTIHRVLRTDHGTQWLAVHGPQAPEPRT